MMPDSVAVEILKNAPPDPADIALAVAGLVVTAGAAFGAAWVGGKMAAKSGREAIRTEFAEERRRSQRNLLARMAHNLPRLIAVCDEVVALPPGAFIPLRSGEELEVIWNTYYRASEPIFTIGTADFQHEAESLFGLVHNVGVDIRNVETAQMGPEKHRPLWDEAAAIRQRVRGDLRDLRARAEAMREEVGTLLGGLDGA